MLDRLLSTMTLASPAPLRSPPLPDSSASRRPDISLLLNPSRPTLKFPSSFPPPPQASMHASAHAYPAPTMAARPPMHPHQYSSSSITSVSSTSSSIHSNASEEGASSHSSGSPPGLHAAGRAPALAASAANGVNGAAGRRRFCCSTCGKDFSTSGHLARHIRVHTGERNHPCPYPGCNARCSRQDNLVQHFRVHMPREERRANSTAVRTALQRCLQSAGSSLTLNGNDSTISSHGTTPTPMSHGGQGHHGRADSEVPSLPDGGSRSPSPIDSVPLTSPGFGPDGAPGEAHWIDSTTASYPNYNSYVRAPLSSPGPAQSAHHSQGQHQSHHPTMQLPLPAPSFPYSLPLSHPHPSYHHAHAQQQQQQQPLPSPTYQSQMHHHTQQYPPPLSPSSGSTMPSSGNGNSPLTPGWPNTSAIRGTMTGGRTSIRVPVGPASAPAQVIGTNEWPWYGWQGENKA